MTRILLFGASGYAGSRIRDEALRRGHQVTAVSRGGPVAASLYDRDAVLRLAEDADVLVSAITSGPDAAGNTLPDAVPILVAAAQRSGVRIGVVGGAGGLLLSEGGEQVISRLAAIAPPDKLRDIALHIDFLDRLRETPEDVDWFYLSPPTGFGAHVPGVARGHYRLGADVLLTDGQGNSEISGDDFAVAFLDEIEDPRHRRRRFTVAY
ncbi:NAD-dependent epimerase [Mycolicibacterium chitae]|uniref:Azoreductase B n=1 Tax=Mycolicibacterium chitae TaxID=1792 RepID=A0A3S5EIJ4_MYCCI|nr:NAD(P)H-binding protein [Mycolicibacterium chitae]MCV7104485.1 NAD(P)H-binding protein [Mycolicibacterium chitae]BBZ05448.1 NAD-dependent epimerase [Mycolicibacterium chitae]VEG49064.1 azoreductase B [Mycolicibacterium chitae]